MLPKIKQLASNFYVVDLPNGEVYVSYQTPVAAMVCGEGSFRRKQFFSVTTSKQLNRFCSKGGFKEIDEAEWSRVLSALLGEKTAGVSAESPDEKLRRVLDIR